MSDIGVYNSPHVSAVRRKILSLMKDGVSQISRMAERSGLYKSHIHHHLQQLVDELGVAVKIGDRYYLKKTVLSNRRRFVARLRNYREKILRYNVKGRPNTDRLEHHLRRWHEQRRQLENVLGTDLDLSLGPFDILEAKRETVINSLEQPSHMSRNIGRKFEQIHEYARMVRWCEDFFGVEVDEQYRKIPIRNPDLREKVESTVAAV